MKATSKHKLAYDYGISYSTMIKWLKQVPNLGLLPNQKLLTPKQLEKVHDFHGEP